MSYFGNSPNVLNPPGFSGGSAGENLPSMPEKQFRPIGPEDPLEKEMATHFSILDWEIPWTEEPGDLQ